MTRAHLTLRTVVFVLSVSWILLLVVVPTAMARKLPGQFSFRRFLSTTAPTQTQPDVGTLLLPQWHLIEGVVKSGYGRGSKALGFPTANLPQFEPELEKHGLKNGVYCGWAMVEGGNKLVGCVTNVGLSPTFEGQENRQRTLETYIYDREPNSGDFYNRYLRLLLVAYLRPEVKYANLPALIEQIHADVAQARELNEKICHGEVHISAEMLESVFHAASEPIFPTSPLPSSPSKKDKDAKEQSLWLPLNWKE